MPEEDDIVFESREVFHGSISPEDANKPYVSKGRKFLFLFRTHHKDEKIKFHPEDVEKPKKSKKKKERKKASSSDEQKEIFKRNMENSWSELPNTLKRKKEKISQERLSEYLDDDQCSMRSHPDRFQKHKESYPEIGTYLRNSPEGFRNTCERFRDLGSQNEKFDLKSDTYASQSVIFETQPMIHYHGEQVPSVDKILSNGTGFQEVGNHSFDIQPEKKQVVESNSSDSVINDSSVSSSASEASQNDDSGTDIGSGEASKKPLKEMVSDFEKICTQNMKKNQYPAAKAVKKEEELPQETEPKNQYSDILFDVHPNNEGMFVNKDFDTKDSKPIVYQELSFEKENETYEKVGEDEEKQKHIYQELSQKEEVRTGHLNAEEKAKKKSAEAIAKELSTQIFLKKTGRSPKTFDKHREEFLKSLGYDVSVMKADGSIVDSVKRSVIALEPPEVIENYYSVSSLLDGPCIPEHPAEDAEVFGEELQYFSVAEWRKAVAMGSKRGITAAAMETIVEEPETDTATKLSVREILRRFEELGSKHFSDKLFLSEEEKTATLKQIHETLKCLEEKVRLFETKQDTSQQQQQQQHEITRTNRSPDGWTGRGMHRQHYAPRQVDVEEESNVAAVNDGKHSLLQFAIHYFRASPEKFDMLKASDGSISGSLKILESKNKKNKGGGGNKDEWTWKEQVDLVKFTPNPVEQSLLRLDTAELSDLAVECFVCLMRYMGDLPMPTDVSEVKCVYTILMHCHKFEQLRDEIYCQLMKQTTNNKSSLPESCQRGWRLFSIVAAYFVCSETLKPYLFKYLETAAYDKRRAYHGTATVCLQNLRKTFKYGGRKNVPSVEEITAISAGRNSKRQIYRLPGGTEKVVNTKSTTVVQDVIEELCVMINVDDPHEMEEFSVYCIVEGDTFTMPLAKEEYILDVTTELHKNHQVFYLIFCRSVWHFPLRLDSQLYVEVVFNQIVPDYLEGLLLVMPGESLDQDIIYDISRVAALLHRAADMTYLPTMKETKFLLPKPALGVRDVKPAQWVNMVQSYWPDCEQLTTVQAKAQALEFLSKWPLFGSSFFAVKRSSEPKDRADHILALNRNGVHFIDLITHETILHYPFSEVISTRKVKSEDGTLFLDMKCGNLMQQRITRLQTDQAHEISRLIRQYITLQQRMAPNGNQ